MEFKFKLFYYISFVNHVAYIYAINTVINTLFIYVYFIYMYFVLLYRSSKYKYYTWSLLIQVDHRKGGHESCMHKNYL